MAKLTALILLLASLAGCTTIEIVPPDDPAGLLTGELLFGQPVAAAESVDMLAMTDEMKRYVQRKAGNARHSEQKLRWLIEGMIEDGLLTLDYAPEMTNTAIDTFESRQGNCLSFSVLFVAMAREVGLDARFQIVDVPPMFTTRGELVVLNDHINVLVRRIRDGSLFERDHIVDFNTADYRGDYASRRVTDDYTRALFHSNLAVESLQGGDAKGAFAHLKTALRYQPDIAGLWVNLGVLYARANLYENAIDAYNQALVHEPSNRSALVNLSVAHSALGNVELAQLYLDRIDYYLDRNPYYHFSRAVEAYSAADYDKSLSEVDEAIALKDDDHRFFLLKAMSYDALEDSVNAEENFEKARLMTANDAMSEHVSQKIARLKRS